MSRALALTLAVVCGTAMAAQARINGELGSRLGNGVAAAAVSFGSGLLILLAITAALPQARRGLRNVLGAVRGGTLRWWQCTGGAFGAALVASQGLTVTTLGVALFSVAVVCGQVTSSLLADRAGAGPGGPQPVTGPRLLGAGLALAAVAVAVADRLSATSDVALAATAVLAGAGIAWQQAINGRVREAAGGALPATLLNFATGTAVLVTVLAAVTAVRGLPGQLPPEPWLYLGGSLGIVFIAVAVTIVRVLGVLLLGLGMVAGQLAGSVALDLIAPAPGHQLAANTLAGTALALCAVAAGTFRRRSPAR